MENQGIEAQSRSPLPDRTLEGAVALITGGGQGLGRTFATGFAAAGARVVVADLNGQKANDVAAELRDAGHDSLAVQVDVADEHSVQRMIESILERFGRLDVLLNNAAVFSTLTMKPFYEISAEEWRDVLDVNLTGVFLCCRAVVDAMRGAGGGSIINMSSATVLGGRPDYLHYVASKAGVVGLTRSMARELGAANVTVNALMPGSIDTGIPRSSAQPEAVERIVASQALQRRLVPEDIAGAAIFLASSAARAITGQTIVIDGGMNFL